MGVRRYGRALLLACCALALPAVAPAQPVYEIPELTPALRAQIDLEDGSVADWEALFGPPLLTAERDFFYGGWFVGPGPGWEILYDPANADWCIWLAWSREPTRLYLAAEVQDDDLVNVHCQVTREEAWNCGYMNPEMHPLGNRELDRIQLFVDGDHSGGVYGTYPEHMSGAEAYRSPATWTAQWYSLFPGPPDGLLIWPQPDWAWLADPAFTGGGAGIRAGHPTVWVVEVYVTPIDSLVWDSPEASVVSWLEAGRTIGFEIAVWDSDPPPGFLDRVSVGHWDDLQRYAKDFPHGLLVGPPTPSAVAPTSWARIKASLR